MRHYNIKFSVTNDDPPKVTSPSELPSMVEDWNGNSLMSGTKNSYMSGISTAVSLYYKYNNAKKPTLPMPGIALLLRVYCDETGMLPENKHWLLFNGMAIVAKTGKTLDVIKKKNPELTLFDSEEGIVVEPPEDIALVPYGLYFSRRGPTILREPPPP